MPDGVDRMPYHKGPRPFILRCGHTVIFQNPYPKRTERLWCLRCEQYMKLDPKHYTVVGSEYRWKCVTCHSGRRFGELKLTAEQKGIAHWRKRPGHTVHILYGDEHYATFNEHVGEQNEIPF